LSLIRRVSFDPQNVSAVLKCCGVAQKNSLGFRSAKPINYRNEFVIDSSNKSTVRRLLFLAKLGGRGKR